MYANADPAHGAGDDDAIVAAAVTEIRALFDAANHAAALDACERLLARQPNSAEALLLLGLISFEVDEPERALVLLGEAHDRAPAIREYADALACVNAQLGASTEALFYAKLATTLSPHPLGEALLPATYSNFFQSFRDAKPNLFRDLAKRQLDKGEAAAAVASCDRQLELNGNDAETWRLLARAALACGDVARVLDACEFLAADGLSAADFDVLARAMAKVGRFDDAMQAHQNAIGLEPEVAAWAHSRIRTIAAQYGDTGGHLAQANRAWAAQFAPPEKRHAMPLAGAPQTTDRPLRIGYVSGALHSGPTADILSQILTLHDSAHFHPYCYSSGPRYDTASENIAIKCARWTDIHGVDPLTAAEILRRDGIDIAVDLGGHGPDSQLQMFAQRPAPVCVSWLGAALPAGAGFDYMLASAQLVSAGTDRADTGATLVRLPDTHLAHRPLDAPAAAAPLPALRHDHVTIGVMAPLAELAAPACLDDWSEILAAVDNARIVVANIDTLSDDAARRLHDMLSAAGIRDRVDIATLDGIDPTGYGYYDHFDVLLDPQPNSRFLETCRALWMGVPVLALTGAGYLGRQAAAALSAAGRPEWVFETNGARAAGLAALIADRPALADLRASLRDQVKATPLFNVAAFTRTLERAYRNM